LGSKTKFIIEKIIKYITDIIIGDIIIRWL